MMCFDKTGTLTKDGLDFLGVQAVTPSAAASGHWRSPEITGGDGEEHIQISQAVENALATCHNLKVFIAGFLLPWVSLDLILRSGFSLILLPCLLESKGLF